MHINQLNLTSNSKILNINFSRRNDCMLVVRNASFVLNCDVIRGALEEARWSADVIIPLTVSNPRLHEQKVETLSF